MGWGWEVGNRWVAGRGGRAHLVGGVCVGVRKSTIGTRLDTIHFGKHAIYPLSGLFFGGSLKKTKSLNRIRAPPPYTRNLAIPRERRRAGKILGILPPKVALSLNLGVQKWTSRRACVVGKLLGTFRGDFCDVMPCHTIL